MQSPASTGGGARLGGCVVSFPVAVLGRRWGGRGGGGTLGVARPGSVRLICPRAWLWVRLAGVALAKLAVETERASVGPVARSESKGLLIRRGSRLLSPTDAPPEAAAAVAVLSYLVPWHFKELLDPRNIAGVGMSVFLSIRDYGK